MLLNYTFIIWCLYFVFVNFVFLLSHLVYGTSVSDVTMFIYKF